MKYKDLISQMTLEEKASLLSGDTFWTTKAIERLNIPAMCLSDGPHGLRKQAEHGDHLGLVQGIKATCFPTSATVANSWNSEVCEQIGRGIGREAAANQVNVVLGPGLNIKRNPLCGRNFEYISEDPYLSGKLAAGYIRGIQSEGVSACPKHFAANSQEHLRMTNDAIIDERTLRELYLTGFELAVREGQPKAIMSSYNKINGEYANENKKILRDILVDEWGFHGMVVTDWGGGNDFVAGIRSGSHLEMPATGGDSAQQLVAAIKEGRIDTSLVDERVSEFLEVLFDTRITGEISVDYSAHHNIAQKAAEESAVLLKNENILPLKANTKVAVIGAFANKPRYQGAGSSLVNCYQLDSVLDVIGEYNVQMVGYAQGYSHIGQSNVKKCEEAVNLAKNAEVALVYIGLDEINEVEGSERASMKLSENQIALLEALHQSSTPIVAILHCGSPVEMSWEKYCDGVLHGYLAGQAGARALLNILVGAVNPSGKLAESYPFSYEDVSTYHYYPGKEYTSEYREGLYVGYRYFLTTGKEVRYPFGFGLSYTEFQYSNIAVHDNGVTFTIKNTGSCAGSEIAQLYVGHPSSCVYRPKYELKGFDKVSLEPEQSKEVSIPFDNLTFRFFDIFSNQFQVEEGAYEIRIGASCADIRLSTQHRVHGVVANNIPELSEKYFTGEVQAVTDDEFRVLLGRKLPPSTWDRSRPLERNDSIAQMVYAKSWLARLVIRTLYIKKNNAIKKGTPDLNVLFLITMPFRAIGKMTNGALSMEMVDGILVIVNGHFFSGVKKLFKSWRKHRRREIL